MEPVHEAARGIHEHRDPQRQQAVRQLHGAHDVSFEVAPASSWRCSGPSGSGKTTLLRIIAGLESPDRGHRAVRRRGRHDRQAGERRVGFVFQHYALFRHMTVFENVAFGLRVRPRAHRPSNDEITREGHRAAEARPARLPRRPLSLPASGGQRQRVALARALAVEPQGAAAR